MQNNRNRKKLQKKGCTKTRVIPVGLDLDSIPPIEFIDYEFIEKLEANKYKILLFVGRLEEYKKPMEFIELMNFINKNSNEYKAILIGNGSLKNKVYEKIKEYSLENSISIIEKVENNQIHKYYKVSSAFINMNDKEIFGMSILEAMYQGCPVVAHNAPGPNDIISSGKSGIIVDNYDKEKWLDAIKIATTNDEFRVNAKKRIINELNWDSIATKFLDVIKEKVGVR
ncbi:glycosyltransferase family 4 protein [Clostridium perfringens]|uniref:glycosyltransferase family 4 protein n=2 Tax=Clostridium perfringens TaxID=1502 RepID=UPI0039ECEAB9